MERSIIKKVASKRKYIVFFLLFFIIGAAGGAFGTYKTLGIKIDNNKNEKNEIIKEPKEEDITRNPDYTERIIQLYNYLSKDNIFYSSTGVNLENLSNEDKLRVTYEYIINNSLSETETLQPVYYGALTCKNNFSLDTIVSSEGVTSYGNICTIYKIPIELMTSTYKKLFNNDIIDVSGPFNPKSNKTCILLDNVYNCGNVNIPDAITGSLTSKFEIQKVIKNEKTLDIYDKGYLQDTRSNIMDPNDGNENYYLHSSDSNLYYYELKSADNLVFAHTFVLSDDGNYRYNGTTIAK